MAKTPADRLKDGIQRAHHLIAFNMATHAHVADGEELAAKFKAVDVTFAVASALPIASRPADWFAIVKKAKQASKAARVVDRRLARLQSTIEATKRQAQRLHRDIDAAATAVPAVAAFLPTAGTLDALESIFNPKTA